ncbi:MAG: hypothetical protein WBB45_20010 [Cyclobacteriaceae bacterium]
MYFNSYLVSGVTGKPSVLSKVVHIVIHDATGSLKDHFKVMGDSGFIEGSYTFPDNLPPGNYTVSAFTRWMEQFDPFTYFQKSIRIVDQDSEPLGRGKAKEEVAFYLEGGKLVAGLTNKVAFSLQAESGSYTGGIYDSRGEQVANVAFNEITPGFQTGHFMLKPDAREQYQLRYRTDTLNEYSHKLPTLTEQGAILSYQGQNGGNHRFAIHATNDLTGKDAPATYLLIRKGGGLLLYAPIGTIKKRGSLALIPSGDLPTGMLEAILVDASGRRLTTRWFNNESGSVSLTVSGLNERYGTREQAIVNLSVNGSGSTDGNFTVTITDRPMSKIGSIVNMLMGLEALENEALSILRMHDPETFMMALPAGPMTKAVPTEEDTDDLESYVKLTGKVTDTLGNQVLTEPVKVMTYATSHDQLYFFDTEKDGTFSVPVLFRHNGEEEFSYRIESDREDLMLTFYDSLPEIDKVAPSVPIPSKEVIETMYKRKEISEIYGVFDVSIADSSDIDDPRTIYIPDLTVNLDEYVRLTDLKEAIREYVSAAAVRKKGGKDIIRVFNKQAKSFYPMPALTFIDGHPVYDMDEALSMEMKDVKKIDVIQNPVKLFNYAEGVQRGVIFIYTRGGDYTPASSPQRYVASFKGLHVPKKAEIPKISSGSSKPYFHSQLAWVPDLKTDKEGRATLEFETSDATGTYYLTISGFTADGRPVSYSASFDVVYSPEQ